MIEKYESLRNLLFSWSGFVGRGKGREMEELTSGMVDV